MRSYTRQEAITLSGLSAGQVTYLDKQNLVTPFKAGSNPKKPVCLYSWEQIVILRIINKLRQRSPLQRLSSVIADLNERSAELLSESKDVLVVNDCLYLINPGDSYMDILLEAGELTGFPLEIQGLIPLSEISQPV